MKTTFSNLPQTNKPGWPWQAKPISAPNYETVSDWPRISIITPSLNQGQFIEETIRSVLLQNYPNLEYIIIDGGSTDNTKEIIKKYESWLAYWVSEPDRGQSHAINKGLERATGQVVAWLNADDIYLPGALFAVAREIRNKKSDWVVGITIMSDTNLKEIDRFVPQVNTGSWRTKNYQQKGWLDFVMTHQSGIALPQPSSFWSKEALMLAGGLEESLRYAMDHDLYGKLAHSGYRPVLIPESLTCFRKHDRQKTGGFPFVFWQEELESARRWHQTDLTPDEERTLSDYEKWFSLFIKIQRLGAIIHGNQLYMLLKRILVQGKQILLHMRKVPPTLGIISVSAIAQHIPDDPVIVEAGAHIGLDTVELAQHFRGGAVHAFEPVPSLFLQLSERTRPYKNVHCYPIALSDQEGETVMYISSGASDGSSSILPPKAHLLDHPDVIFNETSLIRCTTLDNWMEEYSVDKVDLLWLDMQGYELNVLKSGLKILEKVSAIYTEVNLKEVYEGAPLYADLRAWLEAHNFKVVIEELPWEDGGNVLFIRESNKTG